MLTSPEAEPRLRVLLGLHAGLPGLLSAWSDFSRRSLSVRVKTPVGSAHLGAEAVKPLNLSFSSDAKFLGFLERGSVSFSLGLALRTPLQLFSFAATAPKVQRFLLADELEQLKSDSEIERHIRLNIETGWRGLSVLRDHDSASAARSQPLIGETFSFGLAGESKPWLKAKLFGSGQVDFKTSDFPAVSIRFRDLSTAFAAVHNQSISAAAVAKEDIQISGRADLADVLSALLHRVDFLLKPRK